MIEAAGLVETIEVVVEACVMVIDWAPDVLVVKVEFPTNRAVMEFAPTANVDVDTPAVARYGEPPTSAVTATGVPMVVVPVKN